MTARIADNLIDYKERWFPPFAIRGPALIEKTRIGDGKVFISRIEDVIRIRTGEKGGSAISPVLRSLRATEGSASIS